MQTPLALDPADLTVLEASLSNATAVWNFWPIPIDESQHKISGFCSKVHPPSMDYYSPFEKQLLTCSWDLIESEELLNHGPSNYHVS